VHGEQFRADQSDPQVVWEWQEGQNWYIYDQQTADLMETAISGQKTDACYHIDGSSVVLEGTEPVAQANGTISVSHSGLKPTQKPGACPPLKDTQRV
jgi:hypothetical protein